MLFESWGNLFCCPDLVEVWTVASLSSFSGSFPCACRVSGPRRNGQCGDGHRLLWLYPGGQFPVVVSTGSGSFCCSVVVLFTTSYTMVRTEEQEEESCCKRSRTDPVPLLASYRCQPHGFKETCEERRRKVMTDFQGCPPAVIGNCGGGNQVVRFVTTEGPIPHEFV